MLNKIPYMLILGDKEVQSNQVGVRARGEGDIGAMDENKFIEKVNEEIKNNRPKKKMEYDTWDFRHHNDDHSIISCIINAIRILSITDRIGFFEKCCKIHAVEYLLQYCDLYGISIVFNTMEVCRDL